MNTFERDTVEDRFEALLRLRAQQDEELSHAHQRLAALGRAPVTVERSALRAIDEACLVRLPTLTPALRG
jgi:hypothetical protein